MPDIARRRRRFVVFDWDGTLADSTALIATAIQQACCDIGEPVLDELNDAGFLLGVATGKTRFGLNRALEQQGIATRFVATRCADEGFPKPNPDMLLHLMDRVGVDPRETLMIGDTTHDIELARNAGVAAVAVSYGAHVAAGLAQCNPLALVHSVDELRRWLKVNA